MSKILESLPMTIVAGIVLTVIMVFATNYLERMNDGADKPAVTETQNITN